MKLLRALVALRLSVCQIILVCLHIIRLCISALADVKLLEGGHCSGEKGCLCCIWAAVEIELLQVQALESREVGGADVSTEL